MNSGRTSWLHVNSNIIQVFEFPAILPWLLMMPTIRGTPLCSELLIFKMVADKPKMERKEPKWFRKKCLRYSARKKRFKAVWYGSGVEEELLESWYSQFLSFLPQWFSHASYKNFLRGSLFKKTFDHLFIWWFSHWLLSLVSYSFFGVRSNLCFHPELCTCRFWTTVSRYHHWFCPGMECRFVTEH